MEIRHKYGILPYMGMILVPYHLFDTDNPLVGWWVIHLASFKIGLEYPFLKMVVHAFKYFNINLIKVNPNGWQTLLCLSVITSEHGVDLTSNEIRCMYYLKRNDLDKDRAYISCIVGHRIHLKMPDSTSWWKDKYFYIIGEF